MGEVNETAILIEELREAVNEMKAGKAPWLDEFLIECLKKGSMTVSSRWHTVLTWASLWGGGRGGMSTLTF